MRDALDTSRYDRKEVKATVSRLVPIRVERYAGYKHPERPRALHVAGRRHEVVDIVDR